MYISTIHEFNSLEKLKTNGIDGIIIGIPHFSIRCCNVVPLNEIRKWKEKCHELNLKLYINILKFVHEQEIPLLIQTLMELKQIAVDGIYFADEGVLFEAKKLGMEHLCVYQPETLITNSYDIDFYMSQGIQSVSLAHELSIDEIKKIANRNSQFEILISGYYSILYSRRPLITNYCEELNIPKNKSCYEIIEQTRQGRMPILEDENGTYVFSEEPMSSLELMDQLKACHINRFRIDSIFKDDDWTVKVIQSYLNDGRFVEGSNKWYYQESIKKKEKTYE
ncbi:peptidase U32 family protein [Floccifex sp.]|uniref:peptidase U32 family protein n=1 Tax=Floccifex sp. TaxID=2815810 RepID=UPI002A757DB6|nr:U32 family peptidase [Floccifex sp.]MDD7281482.1 U32 family peptidase [Erysipelotrichaceae bacterium]MDY2957733.1 U32 family peptidase [Floccifex sp.]